MSTEDLEMETGNLQVDTASVATGQPEHNDVVSQDVDDAFSFQSRKDHSKTLSVGEILSHARQAQDLTLEDVEAATKIAKTYLRAIEGNDIPKLPELIYTLGFIKSYSLFLGLDVEHCLRRFRQEHAAEIDRLHPVYGRSKSASRKSKLNLAVVGFCLVGICLIGIWSVNQLGLGREFLSSWTPERFDVGRLSALWSDNSAKVDEAQSGQVAGLHLVSEVVNGSLPSEGTASVIAHAGSALPQDATSQSKIGAKFIKLQETQLIEREPQYVPQTSVGETPSQDNKHQFAFVSASDASSYTQGHDVVGLNAEANNPDTGRLVLRAVAPVWVRIEDSGNQVLFQQTLRSGDFLRVNKGEMLSITVRDAGALNVVVDGAVLGTLGQSGEVLFAKPLALANYLP